MAVIDFDIILQEIIEERQSVLFEIEKTLFTKRYNLSQKHLDIFSVQSIAIIYSIWEGYVQQVFQLYIDELNKLNLNFSDFSKSIIIHHMESEFKQLFSYPKDESKKMTYYSKLETFYDVKIQSLSRVINTESNVNFVVLNKLLNTLSLEPFPKFWDSYSYPKPNLEEVLKQFIRFRNGVAHGGDISSEEKVTHQVFEKYKNLVINLMYEIRSKMIVGLTDKTYLKLN